MIDAFAGVSDRGRAVDYLSGALASGRTTHAYLLAGSEQSAKEDIALRFAAALIAGDDADQFGLARRLVHPDLHVLEPASSTGYLVEQIRELVADASLAPVRSARKAYIVTHADALRGAPANAFLKTLEEPPADVVCILLAPNEGSVLETLRSRCEVLTMEQPAERRTADSSLLAVLDSLASGCSNRDLLASARSLVDATQAGADEVESAQAAELEKNKDFLSSSAVKEIEKRTKRLVSMGQRAALEAQLSSLRAWLRDAMVCAAGAGELAECGGPAAVVAGLSATCGTAGILQALSAVDSCEQRVSCNVTPQLAVEAMFLEIREALCRQ